MKIWKWKIVRQSDWDKLQQASAIHSRLCVLGKWSSLLTELHPIFDYLWGKNPHTITDEFAVRAYKRRSIEIYKPVAKRAPFTPVLITNDDLKQ